jgi:hypothetical protein
VGKIGSVDYKIEMPTGKIKTFHVNMLRKYYVRDASVFNACDNTDIIRNEVAAVACVINEEGECNERNDDSWYSKSDVLRLYNTKQKETIDDIVINPDLNEEQRTQVKQLIVEFAEIFTGVPKITNLSEHRILLTQQEPVRCTMYPLPYKLQETTDKELKDMLFVHVVYANYRDI